MRKLNLPVVCHMILLLRQDQGDDRWKTDKLFGSLLIFIYHCCDRIASNGYLKWVVATGSGIPWYVLKKGSNHHDIQD